VTSLILQTAARALQPLMLFVSVMLLLRGHNQPGGGFVGGLVAAAAYGLQSMAFGVQAAKQTLPFAPRSLMAIGLNLALVAAILPLTLGKGFFASLWARLEVPGVGTIDLGSPLLFDVGVYLVVAGAALAILFALEEA
jgi:multicomponent Na+:H+ antiporter subunit B